MIHFCTLQLGHISDLRLASNFELHLIHVKTTKPTPYTYYNDST